MEIVNTYNYYTKNSELEDYAKYKDKFNGHEFEGWGKVRNGQTGEQFLICAFGFWIFDYNLFEYFKDYKLFVPQERQNLIYEEVLLKSDSLRPDLTLEFLQYLLDYIKDDFASNDYFYTIRLKENDWDLGSPARVTINGKSIKISTSHSTYKDETEYKDFAEYRNETDRLPKEWISIEDKMELQTDDKVIYFNKIYYQDVMKDKFEKLFKLCELAIDLVLKIHRNTDWSN
jgi:hypothetical protein